MLQSFLKSLRISCSTSIVLIEFLALGIFNLRDVGNVLSGSQTTMAVGCRLRRSDQH